MRFLNIILLISILNWFCVPAIYPHQAFYTGVVYEAPDDGDYFAEKIYDSSNKIIHYAKDNSTPTKRPSVNTLNKFMDPDFTLGYARISYSLYYHPHLPDYILPITTPPPRHYA